MNLDELDNPDAHAVPWETPEPIAKNAKIRLPKSLDHGPTELWAMVDAVAHSYQVPRDLPFMLILAILATSVGGRRRVRVTQDWAEVLSLYTAVALPSGERKSPVLAAVARPLLQAEEELRQAGKQDVAMQEALHDLRVNAIEKIKRSGKTDAATLADLEAAVQDMENTVIPAVPRLLADDSTPEKLAQLMEQQGGRLGVLSAEGGLFAILAGRYSGGVPNLDLVLKAWSGDLCRVDRVSRETLTIREPVLSIGLAVQPDILAGLAEHRHFRGAGLLARFLFALPKSLVGTRLSADSTPIPGQILDAYDQAVKRLTRTVWADEPTEIALNTAALQTLNNFRDELEPRLHPERGDLAHIADWASKLPGQLVRIAALFTLFSNPDITEITENDIRHAVSLAPYFIGHALDAFELTSGQRSPWEPARAVLHWIQRKKLETFTVRQAWRELSGQAWVSATDDIRESVADLVDLGWVRPTPQEKRRGRPSEPYEVNPAAHEPAIGNFGDAPQPLRNAS